MNDIVIPVEREAWEDENGETFSLLDEYLPTSLAIMYKIKKTWRDICFSFFAGTMVDRALEFFQSEATGYMINYRQLMMSPIVIGAVIGTSIEAIFDAHSFPKDMSKAGAFFTAMISSAIATAALDSTSVTMGFGYMGISSLIQLLPSV